METYKANSVSDVMIVLSSSKDLDEVYQKLDVDENFILQWTEDGRTVSEVIVATNLSGKVKTGEITLMAEEKNGE